VAIYPFRRADRRLDGLLERLSRLEQQVLDAGARIRSLEQTEAVREAALLDVTDKLTRLYRRHQARVARALDTLEAQSGGDGDELEPSSSNGSGAADPISAAILARRATYARRTE
jgi:hypothetical protein